MLPGLGPKLIPLKTEALLVEDKGHLIVSCEYSGSGFGIGSEDDGSWMVCSVLVESIEIMFLSGVGAKVWGARMMVGSGSGDLRGGGCSDEGEWGGELNKDVLEYRVRSSSSSSHS